MNESNEMERLTHESFAQIRFSRVNGNAKFYGSELEQNNYIEMTVQRSEVQKELSKEWYFAHGVPVVQLRMSSGQFAEMITSLNNGGGVPCTLEMLDGKRVEKLPEQESRKEFVHRKFQDRMKEFAKSIKESQQKALDLVKKKTLSKQDIHDLSIHLEFLTQEVSSNIPFFAKCFQESMDEIVLEAKTEVENAIQHKISTLGLEELLKQNRLLLNENTKVE